MIVVTICGKARHGKDSAAAFIKWAAERDGLRVAIVHYADYLKLICEKYFGWDGTKSEEGRRILQRVGTDLIRKHDPDMWVRVVVDFLAAVESEFDLALIPDCRFPNEIEFVKKYMDCISLRVIRENYDNGLSEEAKAHPSETALDGYPVDYTVVASDGVENLENALIDSSFLGHLLETLSMCA